MQVHGVDPVIQVFPEFPVTYHLFQIPVCGTDQTDIDRDSLRVTHSGDCPVLKGPEQLGLKMKGNVPDFIKEECAAVCLLKFAYMVGVGIRERPFHMSEEFAFEKCFCQSTQIHTDHRSGSSL